MGVGQICGEWSRMKGVHILDVLAKTPGLYHVPELRNLLIYIFWGVGGAFWGGLGGSYMWGVVTDKGGSHPCCPRENPMSLSCPRAEKSVNFYILADLGGLFGRFGGIGGGLWGVKYVGSGQG